MFSHAISKTTLQNVEPYHILSYLLSPLDDNELIQQRVYEEFSDRWFLYPVIPDRSWLSCERYSTTSCLGFAHETKVDILYTKTVPCLDGDREPLTPQTFQLPTRYPPSPPSTSKCRVRCVDFRDPVSSCPFGADNTDDCYGGASLARFFVYVLKGYRNTTSPWTLGGSTTEIDDDDDDCVVLLFPPSVSAQHILSFRVGDVAPSWCLFSYCMEDDDEDVAPPITLVYRRLLRRTHLSTHHPITSQPVPLADCLWETYVEKSETAVVNVDPTPHYRLTSPPYIHYESHLQHTQLHTLLAPEVMAVLRREALSIAHWTAWPETQHYNASSNGTVPWNVFPLAHCFSTTAVAGDTDATTTTWIPRTSAACPETVRLLQNNPHVRTVLWSRLEAGAVLNAHTGWAALANHVVRMHIPVVVPLQSVCGTWVDGCAVRTTPGKLVAFDDSKTHRAFHYANGSGGGGGEARIVLIVDVERPSSLPTGTATGGRSEELDSLLEYFGA